MTAAFQIVAYVLSIALVGAGAWMLCPAAGLIAPGTMIWIDLFTGAVLGRGKERDE